MGCLFPFLPLHMLAVGLTLEEARLVSMISPVVALLGPLIASPIADKLAGRQRTNEKAAASTGRYLRVMIAIACFLSAVLYSLLLLVPVVERIELPRERRPTLKFSCDQDGATVLQERSRDFSTCYNWTSESRVCAILLRNCNYGCSPISPGRNRAFQGHHLTSLPTTINDNDAFEGSGDTAAVNPLEVELNSEVEWRIKVCRVEGGGLISSRLH